MFDLDNATCLTAVILPLCGLPCNALYVIARSCFATPWQSPGRDTL